MNGLVPKSVPSSRDLLEGRSNTSPSAARSGARASSTVQAAELTTSVVQAASSRPHAVSTP